MFDCFQDKLKFMGYVIFKLLSIKCVLYGFMFQIIM